MDFSFYPAENCLLDIHNVDIKFPMWNISYRDSDLKVTMFAVGENVESL